MIDPIEQGKLDIIKKYIQTYKPEIPTPQRVKRIWNDIALNNKIRIPTIPVNIFIFNETILRQLNHDLINSDPDNQKLIEKNIIKEYGFYNADFHNTINAFAFSVDTKGNKIVFAFISKSTNKKENMLISHELTHLLEFYASLLLGHKMGEI